MREPSHVFFDLKLPISLWNPQLCYNYLNEAKLKTESASTSSFDDVKIIPYRSSATADSAAFLLGVARAGLIIDPVLETRRWTFC